MFNIFIAIALLVTAGGAAIWYQTAQAPETTTEQAQFEDSEKTYVTAQGELSVTYSEDGQTARLNLPGVDDGVYTLNRVISEAGIQYQSADGQVVFTQESGLANVNVAGEAVVKNAQLQTESVETAGIKKQGDPSANKYDFSSNGVDQDCDSETQGSDRCSGGDPIPGIGITVEQGGEVNALDSDDDNDSVPTDFDASSQTELQAESETESVKATDYNSSRSY